jgi:ribosomal protein L37AE/L43A
MKRAGGITLVDVMHEVTGKPRRELKRIIFKAVRERCPLHTFEQVRFDGELVWQCSACKWKPTRGQLEAYEQGLTHGRKYASGGGRIK